jgi:hypothetical protein
MGRPPHPRAAANVVIPAEVSGVEARRPRIGLHLCAVPQGVVAEPGGGGVGGEG